MSDTPLCNALAKNELDSNDLRAWKSLAYQLEASAAAAERDALRYRAWRDGEVIVRRSAAGDGWEALLKGNPVWDVGSWHWNEDLDKAIDAALRERSEG